jgi:outer membrane protein, adhesin transport system
LHNTIDPRIARALVTMLAVTLLLDARPARCDGPAADLPGTVGRAALENPEVLASWHQFEASQAERGVARGGYLPRLDVVADTAREESETPLRAQDRYRLGSRRLTLTQMLFDGFATRNEVARLDSVMRTRYFEFEQTAESVGLDAVQAYHDVLRRHELVALAEDNFREHQRIFRDIEQRVLAGVSRKVDLEQANARLALAETNLLIETANLHDVTARFQRVVGELPPATLAAPELPVARIPDDVTEALKLAYTHHPRLKAARATVEAALAEQKTKTSPFVPRVDFRMSRQFDEDTNGIDGSSETSRAELVVSYNVFNGGSDWSRRRQFKSRVGTARELRDLACREVRQTLAIAHNDIRSLGAQLDYLDRNQQAIGKARLTYRQQFSIGQRTLLDLLDSENEYFEVRRRFVNARYDLGIAHARALAGMGMLLDSMHVEGRGAEYAELDSGNDVMRCPLEVPPSIRPLPAPPALAAPDPADKPIPLPSN